MVAQIDSEVDPNFQSEEALLASVVVLTPHDDPTAEV
jgi:hypothetical protein